MVLDVIPSECERVRESENVDDVEGKQFFQENGIKVDRERAKNQLEGEYADYVSACKLEVPENVETDTFYHASPKENRESIEKQGLNASRATDCPNDNGIFVTSNRREAEGWAETIGAERNFSEFDIFKVEVPECMTVTSDEVPINKGAVPDSEVACSDNGLPASQVERVKTVEVDPSDESNMGGFR